MTMPAIAVNLNGDGAWADLADGKREIVDCGTDLTMCVLAAGMASGKPSVSIRLDLPDRPVTVIVQTSLAALEAAVRTIVARYGSQTT